MQRFRAIWIGVAFAAALLLPLWFLGASLATKLGLLDWRTGFGVMTFTLGAPLVGLALVLGIVALVLALVVKPRWGLKRAIVGLLLPLAVAGVAVTLLGPAQTTPFIHDVSTDVADPPTFGPEIVAARAAVGGGYGVERLDVPIRELPSYRAAASSPRVIAVADKTVGDLIREGFPEIKPLRLAIPPAESFAKARAVAQAEGWTIVRIDPAAGVLDATDELFWFGFRDDIAVRVRPVDGGSLIDVRSASRVGLSDAGVNAKRVTEYLAAVTTG